MSNDIFEKCNKFTVVRDIQALGVIHILKELNLPRGLRLLLTVKK
jgi:hypothetical protein